MSDKYLKNDSGNITEVEASNSSSGAGDAGKIPALDSTGKLDSSMMPTGIGADTSSILASENLAAGDFVNIYDNSGTANCRKADATTAGKEAHGFVLATVTSGSNATVYFEGANDQCSGLTAGMQFLSTTAGTGSTTAPSSSGNIVQKLGVATSATSMNFEAGNTLTLV